MKETQTYEQSNNNYIIMAAIIIFMILIAFLFLYFGLPIIRDSKTQINIPDKFDININEKNY